MDTLKQEIELDKMDDTNGEINPYQEIITNKAEKDDTIISQMEQWSILSNVVNYVPYNWHPRNFYDLDITVLDQKNIRKYIIKILVILQRN